VLEEAAGSEQLDRGPAAQGAAAAAAFSEVPQQQLCGYNQEERRFKGETSPQE